MWVRVVGVTAALLAGCWAAAVQAGQYTEVWNPPEAQQVPKHARNVKPAGKTAMKVTSGSKSHAQVSQKASTASHARDTAKPGYSVARKAGGKISVASSSKPVKGASPHLTSSPTAHSGAIARTAANGKIKTAQAKHPHPHPHPLTVAHAKSQKLATRTAPRVSRQAAPTMDSVIARANASPAHTSATRPAPVMTSATNSPAAESSNLPPILH